MKVMKSLCEKIDSFHTIWNYEIGLAIFICCRKVQCKVARIIYSTGDPSFAHECLNVKIGNPYAIYIPISPLVYIHIRKLISQ